MSSIDTNNLTRTQSSFNWKDRFINFTSAMNLFTMAIALREERPLTTLETHGVIHTYEFSFDLAIETLKVFLASEGYSAIVIDGFTTVIGPRDIIREAAKRGIITNEDIWLLMVRDRLKIARSIEDMDVSETLGIVTTSFYPCMIELLDNLETMHVVKE